MNICSNLYPLKTSWADLSSTSNCSHFISSTVPSLNVPRALDRDFSSELAKNTIKSDIEPIALVKSVGLYRYEIFL